MKAHLTATDWPRADDPAYLASLRADGDQLAGNACPFAGAHGPMTGGLAGMSEDALGHLYLADGMRGVFADGSAQCGCGARRKRGQAPDGSGRSCADTVAAQPAPAHVDGQRLLF